MSCSGDNSDAAGAEKGKSLHGPGAVPMQKVVEVAAHGFGGNASNYEAHRPGYSEKAVNLIAEAVLSVSHRGENIKYQVLELGAGTGKLTEQLVKELPASSKYLALEPSGNFLDTLEKKCLGVDSVKGSTVDIPLPDHSVQAVVCAQSFHWFSDVPNLESIHRVLAPGGLLILLWNRKHFDEGWLKVILEKRLEVMQKVGSPRRYVFNTGEWRQDIDKSYLFKLDKQYNLPGIEFGGPLEKVLANVTTVSAYNALPQEERDARIQELRDMITNWPGLDLHDLKIPTSTDLFVYVAQDQNV